MSTEAGADLEPDERCLRVARQAPSGEVELAQLIHGLGFSTLSGSLVPLHSGRVILRSAFASSIHLSEPELRLGPILTRGFQVPPERLRFILATTFCGLCFQGLRKV